MMMQVIIAIEQVLSRLLVSQKDLPHHCCLTIAIVKVSKQVKAI